MQKERKKDIFGAAAVTPNRGRGEPRAAAEEVQTRGLSWRARVCCSSVPAPSANRDGVVFTMYTAKELPPRPAHA